MHFLFLIKRLFKQAKNLGQLLHILEPFFNRCTPASITAWTCCQLDIRGPNLCSRAVVNSSLQIDYKVFAKLPDRLKNSRLPTTGSERKYLQSETYSLLKTICQRKKCFHWKKITLTFHSGHKPKTKGEFKKVKFNLTLDSRPYCISQK